MDNEYLCVVRVQRLMPWLVFKTCYRAMEIIHIKFFEMSVNIICQFQNWTNSKHYTVGNQDLLYQYMAYKSLMSDAVQLMNTLFLSISGDWESLAIKCIF